MLTVIAIILSLVVFAANVLYFIKNGNPVPLYPEMELGKSWKAKKVF
jgi:hypothetical protein